MIHIRIVYMNVTTHVVYRGSTYPFGVGTFPCMHKLTYFFVIKYYAKKRYCMHIVMHAFVSTSQLRK